MSEREIDAVEPGRQRGCPPLPAWGGWGLPLPWGGGRILLNPLPGAGASRKPEMPPWFLPPAARRGCPVLPSAAGRSWCWVLPKALPLPRRSRLIYSFF